VRRIVSMMVLLSVVPAVDAASVIVAGAARETTLGPGAAHEYELQLRRGESADVVVQQKGVDVVVELRAPNGVLVDEIDGPTGRNGDERVEIIAAEGGPYRLTVRPYGAGEPAGAYRIEVRAVRSVAATGALLQARAAARARATDWLRARSALLADPKPFDEAAARARVLGLGEATHGSRELGDARLELTRRLVQRHGYRIVAIEASASRLQALVPYVSGATATPAVAESGWIGRRALRELIEWLRTWNLAHRTDRVRLVGVDAQENGPARAELGAFLQQAYGDALTPRWTEAEKELAAADEQTAVFGDSSVKETTRTAVFDIVARLTLDEALLRARYGDAADRALAAARTVAGFADFNADAAGSRSRDWFMADAVLRALSEGGKDARAIYWAHNAHVAARGPATGALLLSALGCGYMPVALTFGAGSFVAQVPNDAEDRLAVSEMPVAPEESIESVLAPLGKSPLVAVWPCGIDAMTAPEWLRVAHPMHWIGALWIPGGLPSAAFRPFDLLHDFDGVVYVPRVTAEDVPTDRPRIAPRVR
jgi:erythromycin esterase